MATDFFQNQDLARRNTSRLVALFVVAVIALMGMLYALAVALMAGATSAQHPEAPQITLDWTQPELLLQVALGTLAIVAGGSLYKTSQLRGGGSVVAESLGGQRVAPDTPDPQLRKLLNVVEEMAIASGTPAPPVYVLADETGINAFAAGFTPGDAVIGVTRGCVEQLSRDELQGVIAHEFSHILNGDMRLNIRLMGVLHGILIIGIIGYFLLRSSMFSSMGRRRDRDNSGMAIVAAGIGLMVVGFLGTFFGNLIKASVSRQREFLADASATQFTRNPDGIAGALKRIGGYGTGSAISSPNAPEASHLFFGQALSRGMYGLLATHPPLDERIRRLDPSWDPESASRAAPPSAVPAGAAGFAGQASGGADLLAADPEAHAIDQIGHPTGAHVAYSRKLIASLPEAITSAVHEPYGARAVIYALLIDRDSEPRKRQADVLSQRADPGVALLTQRLLPEIEALGVEVRLPLVDLAIPALASLSPAQFESFEAVVRALAEADDKIDLFEWTLQRILLAHLKPHFGRVRQARVKHSSLRGVARECAIALSILCYAGKSNEEQRGRAFEAGRAQLDGLDITLLASADCGLGALDAALGELATLTPRLKQKLLAACASCISADHEVTVAEGELLRAIADSLGCPLPPLLPGQPLQ